VDRLSEIFGQAMELPESARAEFIEKASGGDARVRLRVEELLAAHNSHSRFLENPSADPFAALLRETEQIGDWIGPYRLIQKIGEGGCGVVYLAEQEKPLRRKVALKLLRWGTGTRELLSRFSLEQRVLARMNHPNIARILDAGVAASGRPYFAMEWIEGTHLDEYCLGKAVPVRTKVEIVLAACLGVAHAHALGVIHRDLKPSNILVAEVDGVAVPKVIDFGIAKPVEGDLAERSFQTVEERFLGTANYASPEQREGRISEVDARTDVFSLGIVLYQVLAGVHPSTDPSQSRGSTRKLEWSDVVPPSTRLRALRRTQSTAGSVASRQGTDRQVGKVGGDLDWIVMKAIEPLPARRYSTAIDFAADLQRYLDDAPVVARPPDPVTRLHRTLRRNQGWLMLLAGMMVPVLVLVFLEWRKVSFERAEQIGRHHPSSVWTGRQLLVWGGANHGRPRNDGWVYDPVKGRATAMASKGAPGPRIGAASVWTGREMFVWGGSDTQIAFGDGAIYDPLRDRWRPVSTNGAPTPRINFGLVSVGDRIVMWGGQTLDPKRPQYFDSGYYYDLRNDAWSPIPSLSHLSPRTRLAALWTGKEVLVWGGESLKECLNDGAALNPNTGVWRLLSTKDAPKPSRHPAAVWTGRELLVFGGLADPADPKSILATGSRYNPETDTWTAMTTVGGPPGRHRHQAVWTGRQMIVWGGLDGEEHPLGDGALYDPALDVWKPVSTRDAPSHRFADEPAAWTGSEMILWGGSYHVDDWDADLSDGGRYNPVDDRWTPIPVRVISRVDRNPILDFWGP
jgi:serine/threonine protein kinase/N-acetylneuraminic acid mutarotase